MNREPEIDEAIDTGSEAWKTGYARGSNGETLEGGIGFGTGLLFDGREETAYFEGWAEGRDTYLRECGLLPPVGP